MVAVVHSESGGGGIDIIAHRHHVFDVGGGLVIDHPVHLGVVNGGICGSIILRIGDGDQREVLPAACAHLPPIEGDGQIAVPGIAHMDGERGRRRHVRSRICRGNERGCFGARFRSNGAPGTQAKLEPVIVPFAAVATESPTVVPVPSLRPQRATRPEPLVTWWLRLVRISVCVSARFQTRDSSRMPGRNRSCRRWYSAWFRERPAGWYPTGAPHSLRPCFPVYRPGRASRWCHRRWLQHGARCYL